MNERDYSKEAEFVGPKQIWKNRLILRILRNNKVSGRLFEGGFGQGMLMRKLKNLPVEYHGIEYSSELVRYVKSTQRESNAILKQGDIAHIDEEDESFDAVVSSDVIEHVEDDRKAVEEFYRVLKKGGICIITVPLRMEDWTFIDDWSGHFRRYSIDSLRKLFSKQGFQNIRVIPYSYSIVRFYYYKIYLPFQRKRKGKDLKKKNKSFLFRYLIKNISKAFYLLFILDRLFVNKKPMNALLYARK